MRLGLTLRQHTYLGLTLMGLGSVGLSWAARGCIWCGIALVVASDLLPED